MKHKNLHEAPGKKLARALDEARGAGVASHTRPTGLVHLGDGDVVWTAPELIPDPNNPGGPLIEGPNHQTWSVRDVPAITETLTRDLDAAETRLIDAEAELQTVQDTLDAMDLSGLQEDVADALASANGRNSRIISLNAATGTTHPVTGNALVEGDSWWQWDNTTDRNIIGAWVWDGTAWKTETLADSVLGSLDVNKLMVSGTARMTEAVVQKIIGDAAFFNLITVEALTVTESATIDSAVIAKLAAAQIAAQVLRTEVDPATGLYAVMDSSGFRVIDNNAAAQGNPAELVRLGPHGQQLLQLGTGQNSASIDSGGNVTARTGSFSDLYLGGRLIPDNLDSRPRGIVAYKPMIGYGNRYGSGRDYVLWFQVDVEGGRVYKLSANSIVVETENSTCDPMLTLHYTTDGTFPSANWGGTTIAESHIGPFGGFRTMPPMEGIIDLRNRSGTVSFNAAVALRNFANNSWVQTAAPVNIARLVLEDVGTSLPERGTAYYISNSPPARVRTVQRWYATGWANYNRDSTRIFGDDKPTQGQYSTINRETVFFFDDMTAALAGATIHRITLFSWADHWYGPSGTGRWHWHNHFGSIPASNPNLNFMVDTSGWPRGAARTIDINPDEFGLWRSGARRGYGFSTSSTSTEYYGKFSPELSAHFVEIDYEK